VLLERISAAFRSVRGSRETAVDTTNVLENLDLDLDGRLLATAFTGDLIACQSGSLPNVPPK